MDPLNLALVKGDSIIVHYSLFDLDLRLDDIPAASNHTNSRRFWEERDALFDRIEEVMESYQEVGPL